LGVGAVLVTFTLYDRILWRKRPFNLSLTERPVIRATWRGILRSTYVDPGTGQAIDPIDVFLVVHQTYSSLSLMLITRESKSTSIVAALEQPAQGQSVISSTYVNVPKLLIQDRSRIHRGSMILEVSGSPPRALEGFYWTDRDTKGEVEFWAKSSKLHSSFQDASTDPSLSPER
jgi:hypothetical protein